VPELVVSSTIPIAEAITNEIVRRSDTSECNTTATSLAVDAPASDTFSVAENKSISPRTLSLQLLPHWILDLHTRRRLLIAFTHGLPPLSLSPPRPTPQSICETQNKSRSQNTDTKRNLSHKASSEAAPTSYSSIRRSLDTVSTPHFNSTVPEGSLSTALSVSFNDLQLSDLDKLFHHSFLGTGRHLYCSPSIHSSAART
jgi:hypothetical protein